MPSPPLWLAINDPRIDPENRPHDIYIIDTDLSFLRNFPNETTSLKWVFKVNSKGSSIRFLEVLTR